MLHENPFSKMIEASLPKKEIIFVRSNICEKFQFAKTAKFPSLEINHL